MPGFEEASPKTGPLPSWFVYALPAVVYAGLIFFASSLPSLPGPPIFGKDKVLHFFVYLGFGVLCARALWAYGFRPPVAALVGVVLTALYGVSDEVHQLYVPGRSAEVADWMADLLGGGTGAWLWLWIHQRKENPP